MKRKNSKASKPTSKTILKKQSKNKRSKATSGPGSDKPAQVRFVSSFKEILGKIVQEVPEWELKAIPDEDFVDCINEITDCISKSISDFGEKSYIAKKAALFLTELLHGALRKDQNSSDEIPVIHAKLIDSLYSSIDSARTGIFDESEVDVHALDRIVKESKNMLKQAKLQAKVKKLVLP